MVPPGRRIKCLGMAALVVAALGCAGVSYRLLDGSGRPGKPQTGASVDTEGETLWLVIERNGG